MYDININSIEYPFGRRDRMMDYGTLRVKKFNRTNFVMDGEGEFLQPITDDFSVRIIHEITSYTHKK